MFWKNRRVFITGANGFIGNFLTDKLTDFGAHVERCKVNLLTENLIETNYADPQYIFHLAAYSPAATDPVDDAIIQKNNEQMTKNILEFAKRSKAVFIFASSSHVYPEIEIGAGVPWKEEDMIEGSSVSSLGLSKQKSEFVCNAYRLNFKMDTKIVRISNVYGPGDKSNRFIPSFFRRALRQEYPLHVFGNYYSERDFIYVDDVVLGLLAVAQSAGVGIYNLGNGIPITIKDMVQRMSKLCAVSMKDIVFEDSTDMYALYNVLNIDKILQSTSFESHTTLDHGLEKTYKWWLDIT